MKSTPEQIDDVVRRWNSGDFASFHACAKETGVLRQTIQKRVNGAKPAYEAHGGQQKMPPEMEDMLVEWIKAEDLSGNAPGFVRTCVMAEDMLQFAGLPAYLGENWHKNFAKCHPDIKAVHARQVEAERVNACNEATIIEFFERYKEIKAKYRISDDNTYNMDEMGTQMGDTGREKVFMNACAGAKHTITKKPAQEKWITLLECVSATGRKIEPLIIFTAKTLWMTWFPRNMDAIEMKD